MCLKSEERAASDKAHQYAIVVTWLGLGKNITLCAGKAIVGVLLVVGCLIATCAVLTGFPVLAETLDYLRDEVLR